MSEEKRHLFWHLVETNANIFDKGRIVYDDANCAYTLEQLRFPGAVNTVRRLSRATDVFLWESYFDVQYEFVFQMALDRDFRPDQYKVQLQYTGSHVVDMEVLAAPSHEERAMISLQVIDLIVNQGRRCPLLE